MVLFTLINCECDSNVITCVPPAVKGQLCTVVSIPHSLAGIYEFATTLLR